MLILQVLLRGSSLTGLVGFALTSIGSPQHKVLNRLLGNKEHRHWEVSKLQLSNEQLPHAQYAISTRNLKWSQVPKSVEFKFFCKVVHLLTFQDEACVGEGTQPCCVPTSESLTELALKYFRRKFRRKNKDGGRQSALAAEEVLEQERMLALRSCLESIFQHDVYQVAEDRNNSEVQTDYLRRLVSSVIARMLRFKGDPTGHAGVLGEVLKLNHSLLEPWLPLIFLLGPVAVPCGPGKVADSACFFVDVCVELYSKLRQLPVLLKKRAEALQIFHSVHSSKRRATGQIDISHFSLSPSSRRLLGQHIGSLPPGQATEVLEMSLEHLESHLQVIRSSSCEDSGVPSSGDSGAEVECSLSLVLLWSVEELVQVLASSPDSMWEAARSRDKSFALLEKLVNEKSPLLMKLAQVAGKDSMLVTAALCLLCECCCLLFRMACSQCGPALPEWPLGTSKRAIVLKFIPKDRMKMDFDLQPAARYYLRKLIIVHLRYLAFSGVADVEDKAALDFVVSFGSFEKPSVPWNGQVSSLVSENLLIGYLSLFTSHLPHLYGNLDEEHVHSLVAMIVESVERSGSRDGSATSSGREAEDGRGPSCVDGRLFEKVTESDVVGSLLGSEAFVEMKKLHTALLGACLKRSRIKKLPQPLSEAMKMSISGSSDGSGDVFLSGAPGLVKEVLEYSLSLGDKSRLMIEALEEAVVIRKQSLFLKVLQAVPLVGVGPHLLLQCLLQAVVHQVLATCCISKMSFSSSLCLPDLTFVVVHLLKSVVAGKKKSRKKVILPWDLILQWWYFCLGASEILQENCSQKDMLAIQTSSLVAVEMSMEIALRTATRQCISGFISKLKSDLEGRVPQASRVLHLMCELTCQALRQGRTVALDVHTLGDICCQAIEALKRRVQGGGGVREALWSGYHLVTLVGVVADCCCSSKKISEVQELVDGCVRFGGDLVKWWSQETHDCASRILKSFLLDDSPNPSSLDQIKGVFYIFLIMSSHSHFSSHFSQREVSNSILNDNTHDALCTAMEDTREVQTHQGSLGRNLSYKESGDFVWNIFHTVLASLTDTLLNMMNKKSHWTLVFEGLGITSRKSSSLDFTDDKVDEDSWLSSKLKLVTDLFSQVIGCLLNSRTHDDALAILAAESKGDDVMESEGKSLLYCLMWVGLLRSISSLQSSVRISLKTPLQQVLKVCRSLMESKITGHAQYLLVLAIYLMSLVLALPSQAYNFDNEEVRNVLCLNATTTHSVLQLQVCEVTTEMLLAVIRQHVAMVIAAPGPFVVALKKLLHSLLVLGQEDDGSLFTLPSCCSNMARLLELLSRRKEVYKFFSYIIHEFLVVSHMKPVPEDIKQCLLPGIFALLKGCTAPEIAFLKASLEIHVRESFEGLMKTFDSLYKLGGRV